MAAGPHRLTADFFVGKGGERFSRRLDLDLPPVSVTKIDITVPEKGIDARLDRGVITQKTEIGTATRLTGYLSGRRLGLLY